MTPNEIKNYVCAKLHLITSDKYATSNSASMVDVANFILEDMYGAISWKNLGYFGNFTDLDITGSVRIYAIPVDLLNKIKKIEAYLGGGWRALTIRDINDIPDFQFNEAWITQNFSDDSPVGFIFGNSLYILSGTVAAAAPGIRFWYYEFPDALTTMDSTVELSQKHIVRSMTGTTFAIGLPRQFHRLLCTGLIVDYKESNDLPLAGRELNFEKDLKKKLDELSPLSADEKIMMSVPNDTGENY